MLKQVCGICEFFRRFLTYKEVIELNDEREFRERFVPSQKATFRVPRMPKLYKKERKTCIQQFHFTVYRTLLASCHNVCPEHEQTTLLF